MPETIIFNPRLQILLPALLHIKKLLPLQFYYNSLIIILLHFCLLMKCFNLVEMQRGIVDCDSCLILPSTT